MRAAGFAFAALIISTWFWLTPSGLMGKADAIGYAVCHQISTHSFFVKEGLPMPMCARCSGMYISAMLTLGYSFAFHNKKAGFPPKRVMIVFALFVILWLVDGINSFLHLFPFWNFLYDPNNLLRLWTGSGMGIVAASFLFAAFNQTVWVDWKSASPFEQTKQLLILLLLVSLGNLLILSNQTPLLYTLAMLSAVGVIALLSIVYGMIWIMVVKKTNQYQSYRELFLPLCVGLGLAFLQIGVLDWIRFTLMGKWGGLL